MSNRLKCHSHTTMLSSKSVNPRSTTDTRTQTFHRATFPSTPASRRVNFCIFNVVKICAISACKSNCFSAHFERKTWIFDVPRTESGAPTTGNSSECSSVVAPKSSRSEPLKSLPLTRRKEPTLTKCSMVTNSGGKETKGSVGGATMQYQSPSSVRSSHC